MPEATFVHILVIPIHSSGVNKTHVVAECINDKKPFLCVNKPNVIFLDRDG